MNGFLTRCHVDTGYNTMGVPLEPFVTLCASASASASASLILILSPKQS